MYSINTFACPSQLNERQKKRAGDREREAKERCVDGERTIETAIKLHTFTMLNIG